MRSPNPPLWPCSNQKMNSRQHPGIYVHVPFCVSKCIHCDFYSEAGLSMVPAWLKGLGQEMLLYRDCFPAFDTLYVGGGTPTVLEDAQLRQLFHMLYSSLDVAEDSEITVEANPNDVTAEKLGMLRECGVNRVSLGVQSFDDRDLLFLKRRHTARQAEQALELIKSCGISSLSVDLIYGIPGQTVDGWMETLERAVAFKPGHLSCYQLTVAGGTVLCEMQKRGITHLPAEAEGESLFLATAQYLEKAGYLHYEISNYARGEKNVSRHNQKYWQHVPYLGLGPAAHSFREGKRWWNCRSVAEYCGALEKGIAPVSGKEVLTPEQLELEALYLGLRTTRGVDAALMFSGGRRRVLLAELLRDDYVKIQGQHVVPTTRGFLVADRLAAVLS